MQRQLLVINRSRRRAPNLSALDRCLFGFWSLFLDPRRIQRCCRNYPAFDAVEISSPSQATQVSTVLFVWQETEAGTQRSFTRTQPGHHG